MRVWVGLLCLTSFGLCQRVVPKDNPDSASIGRFKVQIHDERLPLQEAVANTTLMNKALPNLFNIIETYYSSYKSNNTPSIEDQSKSLTDMAQSTLDCKDFKCDVLLEAAKEVAKAEYKNDKRVYNVSNQDVAFYYLKAILNMTSQTYYYSLGAYIGVGFTKPCAQEINEVLSNKDEWAKMGSSAATTLMALLPTFLAFGTLYVPRSSEAYTTSALVGLTTAFYSFGLPTTSMSAVKPKNLHVLSIFGVTTLRFIAQLGKSIDIHGEDLSNWFEESPGVDHREIKACFANMKALAQSWKKRAHCWHIPALLIAATQIIIFAAIVYPLFQNLGVPQSILGCSGSANEVDWTGAYLGFSAALNTIFRYIRWEISSHERVKVYSLSNAAKNTLRQIVSETAEGETTSNQLPPLLPPYLLALQTVFQSLLDLPCRLLGRTTTSNLTPTPSLAHVFMQALRSFKRRTHAILCAGNFFTILNAGFIGDISSARRYRPVYILIHLSTSARNPFVTLLTGFIEAALLLVLTFFFAAQWGGNLVITMIALTILLVFVTLGRALGLFYVWLSSQVWGLTVVSCDDVDEIRGVLRVICSMGDVLVEVNGAIYFGGSRMDKREGFEEWLGRYDNGDFDECDEKEEADSERSDGWSV